MSAAHQLWDCSAQNPAMPPLHAVASACGCHAARAARRQGGRRAHAAAFPRRRVVEVYINNTDGGEHPFHLHGHDFWVIATSDAPDAATAYKTNYLKRDTVSVPAGPTGAWARIRFVADNPGFWMLHCHIEWHVKAGLSTAILEAPDRLMGAGAAAGAFPIPASHAAACAAQTLSASPSW